MAKYRDDWTTISVDGNRERVINHQCHLQLDAASSSAIFPFPVQNWKSLQQVSSPGLNRLTVRKNKSIVATGCVCSTTPFAIRCMMLGKTLRLFCRGFMKAAICVSHTSRLIDLRIGIFLCIFCLISLSSPFSNLPAKKSVLNIKSA